MAETESDLCSISEQTVVTEDNDFEEDDDVNDDFNNAVVNGNLKCVEELVRNVDINRMNSNGMTPLSIAISNGHVALVRLLLEYGVDVNVESYCQMESRYEIPLATSVRLMQREITELLLLEENCKMEGVEYGDGKSPLQWAAYYGDIGLAEVLLRNGANIDYVGPCLYTCLHYATIADQSEMVLWLLKNGAKLTLNGDDRTALHIASVRGNLSIVNHLLMFDCSYDETDKFNFLPFSLACLRGHLNVVELFIKKTSCCISLNDGLLRAAETGQQMVLEILLMNGADVNCRNSYGESVLSVAAARGQFDVVRMMLDLGAEINVVDNRRYTPLLLSLMRKHTEIVTTLIIHSGDICLPLDTAESPMRMAYNLRHPIVLKYLVLSGLWITCEPWFTKSNFEAELRECDFTVAASRRNVWETRVLKEAWSWLRDRSTQPLKLKEHCRIVIRHQLSIALKGCSILQSINSLPFPKTILKYVGFDEILLE